MHVCHYSVWLSFDKLLNISGTKRERGLLVWDEAEHLEESEKPLASEELYDLPFGITSCLSSQSWVRYIPFCPWKGHRAEDDDIAKDHKGTEVFDECAL